MKIPNHGRTGFANVHLGGCFLKIQSGIIVFLPNSPEAGVLLSATWLILGIELWKTKSIERR